ncbi:lactate utilization protein C [Pseudonocardia hispaniensis]|uniref:Lactate utilization protein C n=1 Tax=Pseudonocardia hispaniensis TaxID=904933 RepID=A0ABW1IXS0_9PSEU
MNTPPTGRQRVLAAIRAANVHADAPEIPRAYHHTGEHAPGAEPLLDLFADRLLDYRASVRRVTAGELAAAVAAALPDGPVLLPPDPPAAWGEIAGTRDDGTLTPHALDRFAAVVTGCALACAETGTIALDGSAGQGRRAITLVPDVHVCVVHAAQVVQTVPELLAGLSPTRPITLVSGPSATSDIELQRVEGVHGPRTLIVVLVSDP